MQERLLTPPRVSRLRRLFGKLYLKSFNWKAEGRLPHLPKFVLLFAPHTTNWDLPNILAITYAMNLKISWFGKKELFWGPLGVFFRWLGGVPIDRKNRRNLVEAMASIIQQQDQIVIGIAPEGTRSHTEYWKSGFYYIAHQAGVPIVFAYLDYKRRAGGFGPVLETSGDIHYDMLTVEEFYKNITAKYPHEVGQIAVRPQEAK